MLCVAFNARNTGKACINLRVHFELSSVIDCLVFTSPLAVQTMTNFEPLHKLQAHDEYILKCLLSPELCEPNRSGSILLCSYAKKLVLGFALIGFFHFCSPLFLLIWLN